MKIDNGQTNFDPSVTAAKTEGVQKHHHGHKSGKAGAASGQDTVSVSSSMQFATAAISASNQSPDVRPDEVARAKQLMADGKVGNDPYRLADSLIDHALDS